MFLGAEHDVRVVRVYAASAVSIARIATRPLERPVRRTIHKNPHGTVQLPHKGNVMPAPIRHDRTPAQCRTVGTDINTKRQATAAKRQAEIAIVSRAENVAVKDSVSGDPTVTGVALYRAGVCGGCRLQPQLDGEVRRADISRTRGRIYRDDDAILPRCCDAAAIQAQRIAGPLGMRATRRYVRRIAGAPEAAKHQSDKRNGQRREQVSGRLTGTTHTLTLNWQTVHQRATATQAGSAASAAALVPSWPAFAAGPASAVRCPLPSFSAHWPSVLVSSAGRVAGGVKAAE